mgnify:CR=1 FL=1|tara:strand:- start:5883 stop:6335 length:453 start_codon:yes stop_codon:yes gene_type:complete
MSLTQKINLDIKKAMLTKDKIKLESLRAIKASLVQHKTSNTSENLISKEDEIRILQKLIKQRRDSAKIYMDQNRSDLAKVEKVQADFISNYLPKQLSIQEIELIVSKVITELKANGLKDMGKVIGQVVKKVEGKADGKTISNIVRNKLSD